MHRIALLIHAFVLPKSQASLTHAMLFPNIVELNTSSIPFTEENIAQSFGRVKFNGAHAFECSKLASTFVNEYSRDHFEALEKIVALYGSCWDVEIDMADSSFLKVCLGDKVYQYRMNPDKTRSSLRTIGVSNPHSTVKPLAEGIEEVFAGSIESIRVRYICDHVKTEISLETSGSSEYSKLIRIYSYVFCTELSTDERHQLLASLPGLHVFTDKNFWEYQFKYPREVFQIHSDFDPLLDEHYDLGSAVASEILVEQVTSLDPEDLYLVNKLKYSLSGGEICELHGGVDRQTTVVFQCPANWQELTSTQDEGWTVYKIPDIGDKKFVARISNVKEIRVCEYEYTIETNALCIESQFIPKSVVIENQFIQCHSAAPN